MFVAAPAWQGDKPDSLSSWRQTTSGIAEGAMADSDFWKNREAEFEKYAKQYPTLTADWDAADRIWTLSIPGLTRETIGGLVPDPFNVPRECKELFDAIARKALVGLAGQRVAADTEPCQFWLDLMREREWHFRVTRIQPCTEWEWDAGVKDGKPLAQVRREQRYTTGDEGKKIYRRTKTGKLRQLSAKELKGKSSNDLEKHFHWLEDGTIERVFETSAQLCEALAADAFELEASGKHEDQVSAGEAASQGGREQTRSDEPPTPPLEPSKVGGMSQQAMGTVALFTDPRYPPPDIWQQAYVLIKEALKAWGFKGNEPENAFWNRWLDQCNWHGETNFLRASIEHCKVFAGQLLGEGRNQDAAVFARVAVGLEKLKDRAEARVKDLIAQQLNPERPIDAPHASSKADSEALVQSVAPDEIRSPPPDASERRAAYGAYANACKRAGVKMTESRLSNLAKENWTSRWPVAKWKACKDRPGDDALIRAAIKKGPPGFNKS
jgi:hypothetical protein